MTARQQIARLLPLVLLVVLVIAGLHGVVPAPRWNGPLRAYGVAIGIALELVFGALLLVIARRDAAARRAAESAPYNPAAAEADIEPPQALRFTLKYLLGAGMLSIAVVLLTNLHLHFFARSNSLPPLNPKLKTPKLLPKAGGGGSVHIPLGPILYALLVIAIVAALVVSIWWSTRLSRHPRRAAVPGGRGRRRARRRRGPPHRAVLRGALLHPPARRWPAGGRQRGPRRARRRAGRPGGRPGGGGGPGGRTGEHRAGEHGAGEHGAGEHGAGEHGAGEHGAGRAGEHRAGR